MIINIRGTGGSGKTTLVKTLMERYAQDTNLRVDVMREVEGRPRIVGHMISRGSDHPPLFAVGKYTTATGGCDTLPNLDLVYNLLTEHSPPAHAIFEGIMASEEVARAVQLSKIRPLVVITLTTTLEDCLASIRERRLARGETKPLNPKNTTDRFKRVVRATERLRDAGVTTLRLSREGALIKCVDLLGIA